MFLLISNLIDFPETENAGEEVDVDEEQIEQNTSHKQLDISTNADKSVKKRGKFLLL